MVNSTISVLPVREAFRQGLFQMKRTSMAGAGISPDGWDTILVNQIMTAGAILIFLLCLGNLYKSLPIVLKACFSTKASLSINDKLTYKRARNLSAVAFILPFSLILSIVGLPENGFISNIDPEWQSLGVLSLPLAYWLIRKIFLWFFRRWKPDRRNAFDNGNLAMYDFFIVAALISITGATTMLILNVDRAIIREALLITGMVSILLFLFLDLRIFCRFIKGFSSFLYLCALEILPLLIFILLIW